MRLPSPVNKMDAASFAFQMGHFVWHNFGSMAVWQYGSMAVWQYGSMAVWQYGIENCQSVTAHFCKFCKQYQPISWNVPGLMASMSDRWYLVHWNYPLVAEDPQ
jgi:hypothetical protein